MTMRARIARAVYPSVIAHSESYNEVPLEEAFSRVRYSHLRATAFEAADAALAAIGEHYVIAYAGCPDAWRVKPEDDT